MKASAVDSGRRSLTVATGEVDAAAARQFSWIEELANDTGADILEGSVVVVLADGTIELADTVNDPRPTGVVVDQIDDSDTGQVCFGGPVDLVLVTASVTAGQYGSTSATPGQATTSGVGNAFCVFTASGTEPSAFLWGGRGGLGAAIGGGTMTVEEEDGTPSDEFDTIKFPDGTLVDNGDGSVSVRQVPVGFIGARAVGSGTFSHNSSGSFLALPFAGTDSWDSDSFHDPSTNNTRHTIPAGMGGKYHVLGVVREDANATGTRVLGFRVNAGTTDEVQTYSYLSTASAMNHQATLDMELAGGDYVEFMLYQDSGGTRTPTPVYFSIVKLDAGRVGSGVGAKAYHSTTQAISAGGTVILNLDSEEFDTNGFHDNATNNSRHTVPAGLGGFYAIAAHVHHDSDTASAPQVALSVKKNGGTYPHGMAAGTNVAGTQDLEGDEMNIADVILLVAGDYLELEVYSANAINVGHALDTLKTSFSIMRIDSKAVNDDPTRVTGYSDADTSIATGPSNSDIVSLTLTPGTWTIWAAMRVYCASGSPMHIYPQLYDVTASNEFVQTTEYFAGNNQYRTVFLLGEITVSATGTYKLRVRADGAGAHALGGTGNIRMTAIKTAA